MEMICECCGGKTHTADRVSIFGMYDNHTFKKFNARSVDGLIFLWLAHISKPNWMAYHSDPKDIFDAGPAELFPVRVMSGKKELRQVGCAVHVDYRTKLPDFKKLEIFRQELLSDPDIPRLLAEGNGE